MFDLVFKETRSYYRIIEMEQINIGFIVMPPGTGKSHYHRKLHPDLIEADALHDYRTDSSLTDKRMAAKLTNDWSEYDIEWAGKLKAKITKRSILMVPNENIGRQINGKYLGTLCLSHQAWESNLSMRNQTHSKFTECYNIAFPKAVVYNSNMELQTALVFLIARFFSKTFQVGGIASIISDV
jgi:hypothetical protein